MTRVISWFSCGAASAVATKLALAEFDEVIIAYTLVCQEHKDNMRFLADCEKWFGQKITGLMSEHYDGDIFKCFPGSYIRTPSESKCSSYLKKDVREKFQQPTDKQILGFTAEERERIDRFIDRNNGVDFYPILYDKGLTKADCKAMVERAGIDLPVMYRLGYHNNNCIGCVKGGMGYWNKIRVDFPDAFKKMAAFERSKKYTILKDENGPICLDELEPWRGRFNDDQPPSCGLFCLAAEQEYK